MKATLFRQNLAPLNFESFDHLVVSFFQELIQFEFSNVIFAKQSNRVVFFVQSRVITDITFERVRYANVLNMNLQNDLFRNAVVTTITFEWFLFLMN